MRARRIKLCGGAVLEISAEGGRILIEAAACVACGRTVTADNERGDHDITVPIEHGVAEARVLIQKCKAGPRPGRALDFTGKATS